MKSTNCLWLALLLSANHPAAACGPEFPNNLLDQGDDAVLTAPVADFRSELEQMKLAASRFQAVPADEREPHRPEYAAQTENSESADLAAALKKKGLSKEEANRIRTAHALLRNQLTLFVSKMAEWENAGKTGTYDDNGNFHPDPKTPQPTAPVFAAPDGLPAEFSLYLEGAYAWHNPADQETDVPRVPWQKLLSLPPDERRYKSTWAAFMLGKSWEEQDDDKAIAYFKQVRDLARSGFKDSTGLAVASLGLEARIYLRQKKYEPALTLYLEQMSAGDDSAPMSLRFTVAALQKENSEVLRPLATNAVIRQVITAYVISSEADYQRTAHYGDEADHRLEAPFARNWLQAIEAAGVSDVESAEKLALAAYQHNQMDMAARWVEKSAQSPVSQWIKCKLLLRQGKIGPATELLSSVARSFPIQPSPTNEMDRPELQYRLFINEHDSDTGIEPMARQVLGELGTLRLARREYAEALDALLRSSFWMDAAYVAERVLSVDELKSYVDQNWPPTPPDEQAAYIEEKNMANELAGLNGYVPDTAPLGKPYQREKIRYLLARRLTRELRGEEAREYYPEEWKAAYDGFMENLRVGWDESSPTNQRASALWASALISRTNGMELFGTELQPDWAVWYGEYGQSYGLTWQTRAKSAFGSDAVSTDEDEYESEVVPAKIVPATKDELERASANHADPERRFHYRYQAAFLALEAAKLMPNNSDETARVLYAAGDWLRYNDPATADLFYKLLVQRNRKTKLGAAADKKRWFPDLNEKGEVIEEDAAEVPDASSEPPVKKYVVEWGETLSGISKKFGVPIETLVEVNAIKDPNHIVSGQKLLILKPEQ